LENARPRTPASIFVALLLFSFAIGSPFIGVRYAEQETSDSWRTLDQLARWVVGGFAAVVAGIIFTIVGARRAPRSWITATAIIVAVMLGVLMLVLILSMNR
jgi:cytochrome bd-type quinol oxidase subunit 2